MAKGPLAKEIKDRLTRFGQVLESLISDVSAGGTVDDYSGVLSSARTRLTAIRGTSPDLIVRDFTLSGGQKALLAFANGMVDNNQVDRDILMVVEFAPQGDVAADPEALFTAVKERLTAVGHASEETKWSKVLPKLTYGSSLLFVDGSRRILVLDTTKFQARNVSTAESESTIKGPQAALNEVILTSVNQLRRSIRSPDLVFDSLTIGSYSHTTVLVAYIRGLTNPDLVDAVKGRLKEIRRDFILYSNELESFLVPEVKSMFPLVRSTERVDWAAREILEGKVVILTDNDPFVLSLPSVFMDFMKTTQDYVFSTWKAGIMRLIRFTGMLAGLYLMPLYIALFSVNPDLVPTKLVMAVAGSRQGVPFPPAMEVILLWFILEIVIEAAMRLPQKLGQTVGLVGAVVVGTAIVKAGLVDDIVIVVATMAALGYFTAPAFELTVPWRLLFWVMIVAAYTLGVLGIVLASTVVIAHLASIEVFGVPYTTPFGPLRVPDLSDTWLRAPLRMLWHRPTSVRSLDIVKGVDDIDRSTKVDLIKAQQDQVE